MKLSKSARSGFFARVCAAAVFLLVPLSPSLAQQPAQQAEWAPCAQCHEGIVKHFEGNKHSVKGVKGTPASLGGGCGACHGDISDHLKTGSTDKLVRLADKKTPADQRSSTCLGCHSSGRHLTYWDMSKHKKNEVACSDCHNVHGKSNRAEVAYYRTTGFELEQEACEVCHLQVRNQFNKISHHPVPEGKMKCSDCHNPHGTLNHAMIKADSVNQLCLTCHADKRGPFIWEHPPVEQNCLNCHQSHGGVANKLLTERMPNLCEDCHDWGTHPSRLYDARGGWFSPAPGVPAGNDNRLISRSCGNCHSNIHGSNAAGTAGKRFIK